MADNLYKNERGHWLNADNTIEWCNPTRITFTREEMEWLLRHRHDMDGGYYIVEPRGGYIDAPITKRRIKHSAYFEVTACLCAELDVRLGRVWQGTEENKIYLDYYLLIGFYCDGISDEQLAAVAQKPVEEINRRIGRALGFISGWRRRKRSYNEYVSHRRDYAAIG